MVGARAPHHDKSEAAFIDRVYEAAAVPELWPNVLVNFARQVDAVHSVLVAGRGGTYRWIASSAECDALVRTHFELFPINERTRRLLALRHAGFVTDSDVFTKAEMEREPVFREFWFRHGYGNGVATAIFAPSGDAFIIHAECKRGEGSICRETVRRLDRLRPHFARAALLAARFELERVTAAAKALELIGLPAAVLGRSGTVLSANSLFATFVPELLQDRASRICLTDQAADRLLVAALRHLGTVHHNAAVRSIPLRARESQPPMIVHLVPIQGLAHDVFANASAFVFITPVVPKEVPDADVVQGLFDLTPAEAKLAALIAAGHRPREASLKLGVSEETARTTLKRVLAKTGLHRQVDLVSLLAGAKVSAQRAG